jgi:hypothetical protein
MLGLPVILYKVDTIHIENGHENEFIVLQKLVPVSIFFDLTQAEQFKHLINVEVSGDKLSGMRGSCHKDGWLSIPDTLSCLKRRSLLLIILLRASVTHIFNVIRVSCLHETVFISLNEAAIFWLLIDVGKLNHIDVPSFKALADAIGLGDIREIVLNAQHQIVDVGV